MHNNFYFLRQISSRLSQRLVGFTLVSCFSQNKDEIVMEFNDGKKSWFIRGDLQGEMSCLTFPETFSRAKKNSIDLFNDALMHKVTGTRQFENERSFAIELEQGKSLVFKMHGNKSNVLLAEGNAVVHLFRNNFAQDIAIDINSLDRQIDWSEQAFLENVNKPDRLYFTFGKPVWSYLFSKGFESASAEEKWLMIGDVKKRLENPEYLVVKTDQKIFLSLVPSEGQVTRFEDPFEAVNAFYTKFVSDGVFLREKHSATTHLLNQIGTTKSWLEKTNTKLEELRNDDHYKKWGDLLMANLHAITPGLEKIDLDDFYNPGSKVAVPLDKRLSAQKNAERYYRKGKNQSIEISKLEESVESRVNGLINSEADLDTVQNANDLRTVRSVSQQWKTQLELAAASYPYREFEYKGFRIWVGKDAKTNDELTLKYSYKEDLWMHVRDDTGSHVLLKHQANKPFPKDVIEYAAGLAAFYSKRKTESLCAVVVTPKKFVRKRKGDPAGKVVVEREEVILVEPHRDSK